MKRRAIKLVLVAMLVCVGIVTMVTQSYADVDPDTSVWTYDIYDNPTDVFNIGETVRIKANSKYYPYEIWVEDPYGTEIWSDTSYAELYTMDVNGITTSPGWWTVKASSTEARIAVAWYHVIPEMPLGVIGVLFACFAGLGIHKIRRVKASE
ncbi:MAG: hypothetical protein JSV58_07145 [Candidatus Bathyarchaeota archaeon]|nr:MAG: hypothetical protein JSV58_07145 [Candidatus Bathyarchaeota archaeon]